MIKQHSWTRMTYEASYRYMRRGYSFDYLSKTAISDMEVLKAADYSYQAQTYTVSGWINDRRYNRFHAIKWRILSQEEQIN